MSSTHRTFRAGAIGHTGAGGFGHRLHLPYRELDHVEMVAVADPDPRGRQEAAEAAGARRAYADYREMLDKESLDVVSVCPRWPGEHEAMVTACAVNGCHVYCEKPFASSPAEGDRMLAAASAAGIKVAVAHQAVYLPQIQRLKNLLSQGLIGEIESFSAQGKQDHRGGGEDLLVLGTHLFHLMRFLAGDVEWMTADVRVNGRPITAADATDATEPIGPIAGDQVAAYYAFESGVTALFRSRRGHAPDGTTYGLEITGSRGRIAVQGDARVITLARDSRHAPWRGLPQWEPLDEMDESDEGVGATLPLSAGNRLAVMDLIEAVETDRPPLSSGEDAVRALEMIVGVYEAALTGGRVRLPLWQRTHPLIRHSGEVTNTDGTA